MNIGLFTDTYFPQINGVGTSVHTLANGLEQRGHTVYIFTPADPKADKTENPRILRMPSVPFLMLKNFRVGTLYSPLTLNKINHLKLDIVHTQTEFPLGMFGKFLSITHHIPMIHTYHTMYEDYVHYIAHGKLITPAMAKEFSRLFCNTAQAVIAPTQKAKNFLEDCGVSKPIRIIPTGIDTSRFSKSNFSEQETLALKKSLGLDANTPVILSLGRIAKEKSIDVIIKALPSLLKKLPETKMLVVGDGPERENLESLARELQISENVLFIGSRPWNEIGKYYQLGTVFVSASLSETQGLTFAEAMAGGIPVIAKKDECIESLVEDGVTGILFENDEELPEKLYTLLTDQSLQHKLSEMSLQKMDSLSVEQFITAVETMYYQILEGSLGQFERKRFPSLPYSLHVQATKLIGDFPKKIVNSGLRSKGISIGHLSNFTKRNWTNWEPSSLRLGTTIFAEEKELSPTEEIISEKMQYFLTHTQPTTLLLSKKNESIFDFSQEYHKMDLSESVKSKFFSIFEKQMEKTNHNCEELEGIPYVRQAIANSINQQFQTNYTLEHVCMTYNITTALHSIFKTILNPNDEVIVFSPYGQDYTYYIENYDAKLIAIPSNPDTFQPNLEELRQSIGENTKAVFINTPNNPTGAIYSSDTIEEISNILREKQKQLEKTIYLIVDESYRYLAYNDTVVPFAPHFYENTLVCCSLNHILPTTLGDIGYILFPSSLKDSKKLLLGIATAIRITKTNAPNLFQELIPSCLQEPISLEPYQNNRIALYHLLTELGFECNLTNGGFSFFSKSPIPDDKAFCNIAKEHGILLVPGSYFGYPGYFRISYCVPFDTITNSYAAFQALAQKFLR